MVVYEDAFGRCAATIGGASRCPLGRQEGRRRRSMGIRGARLPGSGPVVLAGLLSPAILGLDEELAHAHQPDACCLAHTALVGMHTCLSRERGHGDSN
jgi:hypothetical protein